MAVEQIRDWVWRGIARVVEHGGRAYVIFDRAAAAERDPRAAAKYAAADPRPVRYPLALAQPAGGVDARCVGSCVLWQPCYPGVPGVDAEWGRGVPTVNATYLAKLLAPEDAPWPITCVWRDSEGRSRVIRTRYSPDGSFACAAYVDGKREKPPL